MPRLTVMINSVFDSALPRDRIINVVHFNKVIPGGFDEDGICHDVAQGFNNAWYDASSGIKVEATSYDPEGTPPVFSNGYGVVNAGAPPAPSGSPRDVALCLSFYADRNLPRQRGRLYLPMCNNVNLPSKPTATHMNKALAVATMLAAIGGVDIDWEVWSPTSNSGKKVTNAWVDNEWDTQRRRGLKATTRTSATVSG